MSVDLSEYVNSLRREVTPPGSTVFANVTDTVLTGYLADAFWEARLDGFLVGYEADPDGIVKPVSVGGADLDRAPITLIVLYAGIRILRNKILNMNTGFRAKANNVEFEQQNSATVLAEMLKQLRATKDQLIANSPTAFPATHVSMIDALSVREHFSLSYFGGLQLTEGG